jgi:hypothetical protein
MIFRIGVDGDEGPHVAGLRRIITSGQPTLLLPDKAPNLVYLNPLAGEAPHLAIHEALAAVAYADHEAENRVAVNPTDPLGSADASPVYETPHHQLLLASAKHIGHRFLPRILRNELDYSTPAKIAQAGIA